MIVLDASAIVDLLLDTDAGRAVAQRIAEPTTTLHAPQLIDLEVTQVLRRCVAAGGIQVERGRSAITDLQLMGIERYAHSLFLPRIWELRDNLTAYDAAYVALAEVLDATLITLDARLAAAPGHRARIELVPRS